MPVRIIPILCALLACPGLAQDFATVEIASSMDGVLQKALWWAPEGPGPFPLLVALHSWSGDYTQKESAEYLKRAAARGWAIIHPDFRGSNRTPQACGSDAAVSDIVDAVAFARSRAKIDPRRIYLAGVSGGGYMALVMAHRAPKLWTAVSAWVPIADLAEWYRETTVRGLRYSQDMNSVFGGPPGEDRARDAEYHKRSPLFHLRAARGVPLDINAGIHDGHTGSVPVSHSLLAFNEVAAGNGYKGRAIGAGDIGEIVKTGRVPERLGPPPADESYPKPVLFRREAGPVRVTLFNGGHEMLMDAAFAWLEKQTRLRR